MYTVDLHNHTKFSYDGSNTPEEIIENAIRHGVDVIGITDHQFSIGENLPIYYEYIQHCKIKYADKIKVLCGLEIGTRPTPPESLPRATENFDYVLFECLDDTRAIDFYEFLEWRKLFKCKAGLAHTDIFKLGVFLTGGASQTSHFAELLQKSTGLKVNQAQRPLESVVLGMGRILKEDNYKSVAYAIEGMGK